MNLNYNYYILKISYLDILTWYIINISGDTQYTVHAPWRYRLTDRHFQLHLMDFLLSRPAHGHPIQVYRTIQKHETTIQGTKLSNSQTLLLNS